MYQFLSISKVASSKRNGSVCDSKDGKDRWGNTEAKLKPQEDKDWDSAGMII